MSIRQWIAIVAATLALCLPSLTAAQSSCDMTYRGTLRACERDYARRCNDTRYEARRICSYHRGLRCDDARRIAHDTCTMHSGCRREAEHQYRMCRRDHPRYYR